MGCGRSREVTTHAQNCDRMWKAMNTEGTHGGEIIRHESWAVMRLILVSTYKDFKNERKIIHDSVNHDLAEMAKKRRIIIIIEDFNSESKASAEDPDTLYYIAHLMDEAKKSKGVFYLHLLGECSGYIVGDEFADSHFLKRYSIERGISMNEATAIMMGNYQSNALFLRRNSSFLAEIPFHEVKFVEDDVGRKRAKLFADQVEKIAKDKCITYSCRSEGVNNRHQKDVQLKNLETLKSNVKKFLITQMENCFEFIGDSEAVDKSDELVHDYFSNRHCPAELSPEIEKVKSLTDANEIVILFGDGGSGKTTVLHGLAQFKCAHVSCSSFKTKEEMTEKIQIECGREHLPQHSEYRLSLQSYEGPKILVLIDDADELTGEELQSVLVPTPYLVWVVAVRKNVSKWIDKVYPSFAVHKMPTLDPLDARIVVSQFLDFHTDLSDDLPVSERSTKAAEEIIPIGVEWAEKVVFWSPSKCQIVASLASNGASFSRMAELSKHSVTSLLEMELLLMETDNMGHLLIGILCFLTICPLGMREIELRTIMGTEMRILPTTIKRRHNSINFEYCNDSYGGKTMISALRWRFVISRLSHLLLTIDPITRLLAIPSFARKTVAKRYFTSTETVEHFQKRIGKLIGGGHYFTVDRSILREISVKKMEDSYLTRPKSAAAKISAIENDAFNDKY
ncbi:hypothetical protein PFISCL1PPCAC_15087 [Pristionchus fissidentatus]|uniref:AAA protein n=1 Tax=Pristionchus fissidentatus TaxID=1538716 RepID=A0AAV5W0G5_9BILA|nr:hypothetical protein PFISCL1PPCAC_15087 [Pristionchus fissidentatus]